jgi:hypothetical protein
LLVLVYLFAGYWLSGYDCRPFFALLLYSATMCSWNRPSLITRLWDSCVLSINNGLWCYQSRPPRSCDVRMLSLPVFVTHSIEFFTFVVSGNLFRLRLLLSCYVFVFAFMCVTSFYGFAIVQFGSFCCLVDLNSFLLLLFRLSMVFMPVASFLVIWLFGSY